MTIGKAKNEMSIELMNISIAMSMGLSLSVLPKKVLSLGFITDCMLDESQKSASVCSDVSFYAFLMSSRVFCSSPVSRVL